jgi:hypothetical protein
MVTFCMRSDRKAKKIAESHPRLPARFYPAPHIRPRKGEAGPVVSRAGSGACGVGTSRPRASGGSCKRRLADTRRRRNLPAWKR